MKFDKEMRVKKAVVDCIDGDDIVVDCIDDVVDSKIRREQLIHLIDDEAVVVNTM